jgi:DNA-binding NarL/FixJ family response regulator
MLRGVIICSDKDLRWIGILRSLDHYPSEVELTRFLRAAGPNVVFLSVEMVKIALELAARIEGQAPGTQIVVFDRVCQPDTVLETMRAGIREFLSPPFEPAAIQQAIQRLEQTLERKPPSIESSDAVMAFLPSKPGVGCSHRRAQYQHDAGATAGYQDIAGGLRPELRDDRIHAADGLAGFHHLSR